MERGGCGILGCYANFSSFFSLSAVVERISRIVKDCYTMRLFLWVGMSFIASLGCFVASAFISYYLDFAFSETGVPLALNFCV